MPILRGVLFPDQRVASHGIEGLVILGAKGPELNEAACQEWLRIEAHLW
jgi:hypothetical protein